MNINENIKAANERTFELVTAMQESILDATKAHVAAVAGGAADLASKVPAPEPVDAPDPKELIEESFKFQSRLLEVNRSFALSLTDALAQAVPTNGTAAKPSAAKATSSK